MGLQLFFLSYAVSEVPDLIMSSFAVCFIIVLNAVESCDLKT
jgi:hypothetical protein